MPTVCPCTTFCICVRCTSVHSANCIYCSILFVKWSMDVLFIRIITIVYTVYIIFYIEICMYFVSSLQMVVALMSAYFMPNTYKDVVYLVFCTTSSTRMTIKEIIKSWKRVFSIYRLLNVRKPPNTVHRTELNYNWESKGHVRFNIKDTIYKHACVLVSHFANMPAVWHHQHFFVRTMNKRKHFTVTPI